MTLAVEKEMLKNGSGGKVYRKKSIKAIEVRLDLDQHL